MLTTIGVLSVAALMAPTFGVYASIVAELGVELTGLVDIGASIGVTLPTLTLALAVVVALAAQLTLMLELDIPGFDLSVSFNAQVAVLLGIALALRLALSVGGVAGIEAYTYRGTDLGGGLTSAGLSEDTVTAYVFGATSSGAILAMGKLFDGVPFAGGLTVLGSLTLSAILKTQWALLTGLYNEFNARASAMAKASASLTFQPATVAAALAIVVKLEAAIRTAIALGIPTFSANLIASVKARIALITSLLAEVTAALSIATDGFDVFVYQGPGSGLGPALSGRLASGWPDGAPPSAAASALVLVATTPQASAAITTLFPPLAA